jgi:hypothetical protein
MKTNQRSRNYYTLHSRMNDAFTLRINEKSRTAVVGFTKWDDAILIGKMMETHYIRKKEWPDMQSAGSLILPSASEAQVLRILYIQEWEFDDLKLLCTRNILDMISVDDILDQKTSYSFSGNSYTFNAPTDFYRDRFEEFM